MKSEPLTEKQKAVMEEAMQTRTPILNDFYGRYSGIQSLSFLDAKKIRDTLKAEEPSEQFGCTTRMWTMALFDVIANIKSAWSNLANTLKELIRENEDLSDEEKDYLRYVVSAQKIWGDILCERKVSRPTAAYKELLAGVDESRLEHLHIYLRRITRRKKACISHSASCRTLYLDENMYTFSEAEEDGHKIYLFSFSPGTSGVKRITVRLRGPFCYAHKGNIRVVWDSECIAIHKAIQARCHRPAGEKKKTIGIDKGYSTLLSCSTGHEYGEGFGRIMNAEADRRCVKSRQRNHFIQKEKDVREGMKKVREAMRAVHDPELLDWLRDTGSRLQRIADRTRCHNIGSARYSEEERRHQERLNANVNHSIRIMIREEKPSSISKENLKFTRNSNKGPRFRQKMSSWIKGYLDERIEYICASFSISCTDVNPAYTSQYCCRCGEPIVRSGKHHEVATCPCCGVMNANTMAAVNILNRIGDSEITVYTPYKKVKSIMESRRHQKTGTRSAQTT